MRVAFLTRRYWPAIGGVESVAVYLGETLAGLGHEVTVIAQCVDEGRFGRMTHIIRENKRFAPFERHGVAVLQFRPSRRRRTLLLPFALELIPFGGRVSSRWLRAHTAGYYATVVRPVLAPLLAGADVVHVLGGEAMAVAGVESARRLGKPVAISPFAHPGDWGFDSGSIRAYRDADVVIATTRADADVYRGAGVAEQRLRVAGLPVPEIPDAPEPAVTEAIGALPRDVPLVMFLGARKPTKGAELLLAAAPLVWQRHPQARFAFVGPGAPMGAGDERVLEVGRVSDAARGLWLDRASVLCLPSSGESFGLVVPEAWTRSVPVVVSDIPVLRELVEDSGGGLAVAREPRAFAEAINALLEDRERARSLGRAGRAYWESRLTPQAVTQRHLEIYESLLSGRPGAQRPASTC
ncbi:MAG TPA: glycosyltransferase family 4 protein, partial [Solirubrobacteraceae bacterium]|nr:glycosyltransferase family 4 protein [Solirubrobacteraceae bacterium]